MNGRKIDRTELFRTVDRKLAVPHDTMGMLIVLG